MNQFESQLLAAKRKQQRLYLALALTFIVAIVIIASIIVFTRGTRLTIVPEEVQPQAAINVSGGIAFIVGKTLYALSSNPELIVTADGFYTRQQQLTDDDFGNVMTIRLLPLPARLELKSLVTDNRTEWFINEQLVSIGNEFVHELEPGTYTLGIRHPYFETKDMNLSLSRGQTLKETVQLLRIKGQLSLKSEPAGAKVSIDGLELGTTPLIMPLEGGSYELQLALDKFEPISEPIEISRDDNSVSRDYKLVLKKGRINLNLSPANGKLVLNNLQIETAPVLKVEVGKNHTLTYSKPGYFPETKTISVAIDQERSIAFNLQKEQGQLEILSSPEASVFVNGQLLGNTPAQFLLDAVPQEITISKPGFRTVTKQVTPTSKREKKIEVVLVPERIARLQEAPASYQHAAGGELKLFKPNDEFKMGADRSELGQRANEFVRSIRLTRPFYAGTREVTYAEYNKYDSNKSGTAAVPVTNITWIEAAGFCNWLSRQEGLAEVYKISNGKLVSISDTDGYRLLTEAEWEWLARKAKSPSRTRFVWGDNLVIPKNTVNIADESAKGLIKTIVPNYNDGYPGAAPAGSFIEERSGLFDQGGNVREWTHDGYSLMPPRKGQVFKDPYDTVINDNYVVKGSSWRSGSVTELRSSYREGVSGARDDIGFRVGRYVFGGSTE